MDAETRVRRIGGALAGLGALAGILAGLALGAMALLGEPAWRQRVVGMGVGGLVVGIVGAMLLLFTADTVPPEERDDL